MKFVLSTQELNFLITKIQNIVSQKPPIPILSNFLIEAFNNEIKLTATDLTVGIRCNTEASIFEEGATTLPAKKFGELIRELTATNVEISTNEKGITTVKSGSSHFKINGISKDGFPSLPDSSTGLSFQIQQKNLKEMFFRTSFSVSREENRHNLGGICLTIVNNIAIFIGTNGKRLARAFCPIESNTTLNHPPIILSLKAVDEIFKCLNDEGEGKFNIFENQCSFEANNTRIVSKLIEGEYPEVSGFIPKHSDLVISLHREELMTLLRQIVLFTDAQNLSVRFTFNNGELKLSGNAISLGEGDATMAVNYTGPQFEICLHPQNTLEILRHCSSETVIFGFTDPYNPGIIVEGNESLLANPMDISPIFVIMPMRSLA